MKRNLRFLLFGCLVGVLLQIPLLLNRLYLYFYVVGILIVGLLLVVSLRINSKDLYYVHKPFRNTKNRLLGIYCFIYAHHTTIDNNVSKDEIQCETCGKVGSIYRDDGSLWFITHVNR
jgi:hypothetical protein